MTEQLLKVFSWNVYIGNHPDTVLKDLKPRLKKHDPHVVVLIEAKRLYGHLNGLGYKVIQQKPVIKHKGATSGNGDIAILVRNDVKLAWFSYLEMLLTWFGPKHHNLQDPRVYVCARIRFARKVWKITAFHHPFNEKPQQESIDKTVAFLKKTPEDRPNILVGDMNMNLAELTRDIARPVGMKADGTGIDLVAYDNCRLLEDEKLDRGVSDHPAKLYTFTR